MELLPLGSCVSFKSKELLIAGYGILNDNDEFTVIYYCLPYPTGFLNSESVIRIKTDEIEKVIFSPDGDDVSKDFISELSNLYGSMIEVGPEKCQDILHSFTDYVKEKSEEE